MPAVISVTTVDLLNTVCPCRPHDTGNGCGDVESRDAFRGFLFAVPECEIVDDSRKESSFAGSEEETQQCEMPGLCDEDLEGGYHAPGNHYTGDPDGCRHLFEDEVGRDFEDDVSDEECREGEGELFVVDVGGVLDCVFFFGVGYFGEGNVGAIYDAVLLGVVSWVERVDGGEIYGT